MKPFCVKKQLINLFFSIYSITYDGQKNKTIIYNLQKKIEYRHREIYLFLPYGRRERTKNLMPGPGHKDRRLSNEY
jgi:hypothetical protein